MSTVKVTCKRCGGLGRVSLHHRAMDSNRCFCCEGQGFFYRKAPTKRKTAQEHLDELNARAERIRAEQAEGCRS